MALRILQEAEDDVAGAAQWHERQRPGLGDDFLAAVADGLEAIERTPQGFSLATPALPGREVRRHVLSRFPYSVFYEVCPDEVVVLAVVHAKRRPGLWQARQP
jgi:plasmid stabilization system protein ParE